jgi:hypothetical protein
VSPLDNLIAFLSILGLLIVGALAGLLLLPLAAGRWAVASVKGRRRG